MDKILNILAVGLGGALGSMLRYGVTLLLLLTVGFCGGFTTFSTFSSQSFRLFQDGRFGAMALYIALSVILCVVFAGLGWTMAEHASK